jgi:hypothetical protein
MPGGGKEDGGFLPRNVQVVVDGTVRDETPKAVAAFELATISKVAKGCELIVASLEKAPKWLCEAPQERYHGPSLKLLKTLPDSATFQNLKLICRNYHSTHHGLVHSDYSPSPRH